MSKLYHAFPRRRQIRRPLPEGNEKLDDIEQGLEILELILKYGLLCTPEKFDIPVDPNTERQSKLELLLTDQPQETIIQSRSCFTLMERHELSREYSLSTLSNDDDSSSSVHRVSHQGLFGSFAVGLDAVQARELGVHPAIYYYPNPSHDPFWFQPAAPANLGLEIVFRLQEIKTVFQILSLVESKANLTHIQVPDQRTLQAMGISLQHEDNIKQSLQTISERTAKEIFEIFNTDRVASWNIVDFITMLLSLYQSTDSSKDKSPLAYFQQREWRLIHHMRHGLTWFGLSSIEGLRNNTEERFAAGKQRIRASVKEQLGVASLNETKLKSFWVLAEVGGVPFRDFIREIVVPDGCEALAAKIVESVGMSLGNVEIVKAPIRRRTEAKAAEVGSPLSNPSNSYQARPVRG